MIINIENLDFSYGIHEIFKDLSLTIHDKQQIGLIGRNGSGKSTLLKLLTEELSPDSGRIIKGNQLKIAYLAQESIISEEMTLERIFYSVFDDLMAMEKKIASLGESIAQSSGDKQKKRLREFGELQELFTEQKGYEYPSRIRGIAKGLSFSEADLKKDFSLLSGGEKTRACLGQILLKEPDLLLLDEPTNYLDIENLQWLEHYLNDYSGTFVIISHDRYFLDKVCQTIFEVDNCKILSYQGNYSDYSVKKRQAILEQNHHYNQQQKEIKQQEEVINRFRQYDSIKSSKRAASREKALEKIELIDRVKKTQNSHFTFKPKIKSGHDVLLVEDLKKSFNRSPLFQDMSFQIHHGDRIGIIGPNGVGKTTLLRILLGQLAYDQGHIKWGHKVYPAYFDQEHEELKRFFNDNLLEVLWDIDSKRDEGELRNILAAFLFQGDDVFKAVANLSGGEKARLLLARLMISQANFLIMDEPTNHIDMETKEILETALSQYDGSLLFISHDRYFLNRIANKIFLFTEKGIKLYLGNYDDYLAHQARALAQAELLAQESRTTPTKTQLKLDRRKQKKEGLKIRDLKKNIKAIELEILDLETKIEKMEAKMCHPDFYNDHQAASEMGDAYEKIKTRLEKSTDQWEDALITLENLESD